MKVTSSVDNDTDYSSNFDVATVQIKYSSADTLADATAEYTFLYNTKIPFPPSFAQASPVTATSTRTLIADLGLAKQPTASVTSGCATSYSKAAASQSKSAMGSGFKEHCFISFVCCFFIT